MKYNNEGNILTIYLTGRIDASNSPDIEREIISVIDQYPGSTPVFDAYELEYISSAGLRILMNVRKKCGEEMRVINTSTEIYDIFDITGFTELMHVEKRFRELSIDGCEIIGTGFYGTVYRIDDETIIKLYDSPDCLPMIRNEQRLARSAFIKGVPTAISYDIAKVGDKYGSVFELLKAQTFNEILKNDLGRFDEIMQKYIKVLKVVHGAEMDPGTLPMARDIFIGYIDSISGYIPAEQTARLKEMLSAMPDDLHIIHGDFQMKNVMLAGDEPMLIDMETLSTGQPIFDLQALYVTYIAFPEDDSSNLMSFLGLPEEYGEKVWNCILESYFDKDDKEKLAQINDKIRLMAYIRFLFLLASTDMKNGELGEKRIRRAQQRITELLEKVDSFI